MRSFRFFTLLAFALQFAGAAQAANLLDYMHSHEIHDPIDQIEKQIPKYNRLEHFGHWIDADGDCQTTMTEVLIRDADQKEPLQYKDKNQCTLTKGVWHDPYTGTTFRTKASLQIDHVVPLKNAYDLGAYAWTHARRCTYANFLANDFHLLAVSGHENMSKGSNGPENYLPPNEAFHCDYVGIWMKIKAIWELQATPEEVAAIEQVIQEKHCPSSTYTIDDNELATQRQATNDAPAACGSDITSPVQQSARQSVQQAAP